MSTGKTPKWESELWSYISQGDGEHCPEYSQCQVRLRGNGVLTITKMSWKNCIEMMTSGLRSITSASVGARLVTVFRATL